ncbi:MULTISPECIES: response regulator transcription factor [Microbacterium]|uniref:DNA-binding response regulator n=1 Tax=Microbacterium testaceum TaxID=2033 RepID=A0A4Y3QM69_MICTE|nr:MULTISPECIES: response regulator transcription factor [Microbacterium]MDZ5144449.1 response regulator transcription factor [Microbacterium testaceum]PNW07803.1 DNA-binding response regulator [Microbacterium testaceum]REC97441.1 DNA-binding response OmpR family regulator [Microbacterium sp. AG157]WJS89763.1 response regulator transcription factor [Microbacterium testaceum]GEB46212.1 DNA-binding response regulator [Microbacterium testaceum]
MTRILIAEDEERISAFVAKGLESAGYQTLIIADGAEALDTALSGDVDLVLLDVGLPSMDGFEVLRSLRGQGSQIPVIMLTARTSTRDTVDGLDAGANDYVAKPFKFDELLARVRSRMREPVTVGPMTVAHGDVSLDVLARRATVGSREIDLSAREFSLAEEFIRHAGQVLSREQLLSRVWGMDFDPSSNVVDVYVRYLRAKIGQSHIVTVRGAGYRWE